MSEKRVERGTVFAFSVFTFLFFLSFEARPTGRAFPLFDSLISKKVLNRYTS